MIELLAQDQVTHDRTELYAVIGALVVAIGILWRRCLYLERIIRKQDAAMKEPESNEGEGA